MYRCSLCNVHHVNLVLTCNTYHSTCSYSDIIIEREVLMQKYIHLVQIMETEKVAANQIRTQLEDQDTEIERLKAEIVLLNKDKERMLPCQTNEEEEDPDIKKIKKVQSFMRGWLCRRKWKIIVQDYICSPQAENMRKRNHIVFNMVEAETEYVCQLSVLVNFFLRPLRMAASSKKPPISHDDVSSIFLNSETIMFLHEIFHQGLKARIANWPTLVLADLFDILLPMLNIYQEFVRNHQYSLQVLANCKQNRDFDKLLKQYETNTACEERMLETFLTYPMFQIPRYIITLHELLAHTPHEHVERKSLEFAKSKLEELSKMMHDEVSDTENIRKNLAIERMIVEGCDILLDTSQTFVRQGSLIQLPSSNERGMLSKVRLGSLSLKKEGERQCFLFTKHFLVCTRTSGGKLHLIKQGGVLTLIECTLVEELDANDEDCNWNHDRFHLKSAINQPSIECKLHTNIFYCLNISSLSMEMTFLKQQNNEGFTMMVKTWINVGVKWVQIVLEVRGCTEGDVMMLSFGTLATLYSYKNFWNFGKHGKLEFSINKCVHFFLSPHLLLPLVSPLLFLSHASLLSSRPLRSLELFFATNQGTWGGEHFNNKSPRLCRKFSSPPLTTPSLTSSPGHSRKLSLSSPFHSHKLSLSSPFSSKAGVLELSTPSSSAANFPTSSHPPSFSSPSPEPAPPTLEDGGGDMPRIDACCGKLRRSIRRAVLETVSLEKFLPESNPQVSEDRVPLTESPCRSPSTHRHTRYRQSGGSTGENNRGTMSPASAYAIATAAAGHSSSQGKRQDQHLVNTCVVNVLL
ncbi:unnamed protein product [Oncorhynchus mykiss]|uniref:DH domain-containing protein n=1 Tax=Oncorhynchus mykiss TaxID=8022 RepID=A0A060WTB6_ONCMY|nr:unnamed protein product [Oncorhynchus mykiss]